MYIMTAYGLFRVISLHFLNHAPSESIDPNATMNLMHLDYKRLYM